MLVQFTQVAALPADVKARLTSYLKAAPLLMGHEPILFEGYHLSPAEVQVVQLAAKSSGGSQMLLG
jgi:hypothetical protein